MKKQLLNLAKKTSLFLSFTLIFSAHTMALNYSLGFNGSGDYIQTNLDVQPSAMTTTTWEAWIKPGRLNYADRYQAILSTDDGGWDRSIWIKQGTSNLSIGYGTSEWVPDVTLSVGSWYHIAVVYKTDNVLFYLNGVEYVSGLVPSGQSTTNNLRIGSTNGDQHFLGEIDEVRIWNTARTQAQIQVSYASLVGNESNLAGYWRLDEGSGTTVYDATSNGKTGIFFGSPTWNTSTAPISAPVYQTSTTSLDFGGVKVSSFYEKTLTITNNGGGFLNISSAASDNARFTVTPASATLGAGASQVFTVKFSPTALDVQSGTVTFTDNASGSPHSVTYTGTGTSLLFNGYGTSDFPYQITSLDDLKNLSENNTYWNKYFIQTANIDASSTSGWNSGSGFSPIGNNSIKFTGNYNGQGHTIANLFIYRNTSNIGLFGFTDLSIIANLGVTNVNFTGYTNVGGLIGKAYATNTISNCYTSGVLTASASTVGGLVGYIFYSDINNCYSNANVSCSSVTGGLVGYNDYSDISYSYSTGTVAGGYQAGGLVGSETNSSIINYCYSTGNVSGTTYVGGLAGDNYSSTINFCYSAGHVSGSSYVGGLVGLDGAANNSFWDTQTSGQSSSFCGTGKTTAQMKTFSTFNDAGWSFTGTWHIDETITGPDNNGYPSLAWQGLKHILRPIVSTTAVTNIGSTTATGNITLSNLGLPGLTQFGVCWNISGNPTISDAKTEMGSASATGAFTSSITGLTPGTTYFVKAYATSAAGTVYGNEVFFSCLQLPEVTTGEVNNITTTTATGNINITFLGIPNQTHYGVCWSTSSNPTISDNRSEEESLIIGSASATYNSGDISTDFNFVSISNNSACPGLLYVNIPANTTITSVDVEYQMTAQNDGYMEEQRSQLRCISAGGTAEASLAMGSGGGMGTFSYSRSGLNIANNVTGGGNIVFELHTGRLWGGSGCNTTYNKVNNGTWKITVHYSKTATGILSSEITGLMPGTTYHVRAYATNSVGTAYGNDVTFTTTAIVIATSSGNWDNPAVWGGSVPGPGDNVVITAGMTITIPSTKTTVTCNNLTLSPLSNLSVDGTLNVTGNLLIESDATGSGSLIDKGTLNVTGTKTVQLYLAQNDRYYYVSMPVSGVTASAFGAIAGADKLFYRNTSGSAWIPVTNPADVLVVGRGYATKQSVAGVTINLAGTMNTGAKSFAVTTLGDAWNLVGNPYPSPMNWGTENTPVTGWDKTNIRNTIYIKHGDNFAIWNAAGDGAAINGGTQYIPALQSFWVKALTGATTLDMDNLVRVHNGNLLLKNNETLCQKLRVKVSRDQYSDEALIQFHSDADNTLDKFDAEKLFATSIQYPQVFTQVGTETEAINTRAIFTGVYVQPLGFKTDVAGRFTFDFSEMESFTAGSEIFLEDKVAGKVINLMEDPTYTFISEVVNNSSRFVLHFSDGSTHYNPEDENGTTGIDLNSVNLKIYGSQNIINVKADKAIKATIKVYNILGTELQSVKMNGTFTSINVVATGSYIVKVIETHGTRIQKVNIEK